MNIQFMMMENVKQFVSVCMPITLGTICVPLILLGGVAVPILLAVDVFSIFFLPFLWVAVTSMCNEYGYGVINNIIPEDSIMCTAIVAMGRNDTWVATMNGLPCSLLQQGGIVQVQYNHYQKQASECLDIIKTKADIPTNNYKEDMFMFHLILSCWAMTVAMALVVAAYHMFKHRIQSMYQAVASQEV